MDRVYISDEKSLKDWLTGKPVDWAQAIALRAALRALPLIAISDHLWMKNFAHITFSAVMISWTQLKYPSINVLEVESRANSRFGGPSFDFDKYKGNPIAATAADASYHSADAQTRSMHVIADCVQAVSKAAKAFSSYFGADVPPNYFTPRGDEEFWSSVRADCNLLARSQASIRTKRGLYVQPLWIDDMPISWYKRWKFCLDKLLDIDKNYSAWIEWYERRVEGQNSAFDIISDNNRKWDKSILRRIAEATDHDFWSKGHEYVNAKLKGWLDEARTHVAPLPSQPLGAIKPDPQDARSPQFGLGAKGRIAIKLDAGSSELRSDPQSLSRHARALQIAQKLGEMLRNHNNAGYITEMADDYVLAMGSGPEGADPSALVFAGDQLREAITKHRAAGPGDDLQSLPPSADRNASAFLSAHNMYVGSDPFLDDLDRTTRGPDTPLPAASPDEIRQVAATARQDDILAEPTYDYMVAASNAAPATYDQNDRHSRFAAGLAQNFARYGVEFLWEYPNEAAWVGLAAGVGATLMLGPLAAAGGAVAGIALAYNLARNMVANEAIYRKLLATSPAGEDNFRRLMRFLKSLPIQSLKDD